MQELMQEAVKRRAALALVQEPYVGAGTQVIGYAGARVFQVSDSAVRTKAAIVVFDQSLKAELAGTPTPNIVTIKIDNWPREVHLTFFYFEPKPHAIQPYLEELSREIRKRRSIIAGDGNAKNIWWGSAKTDEKRGARGGFIRESNGLTKCRISRKEEESLTRTGHIVESVHTEMARDSRRKGLNALAATRNIKTKGVHEQMMDVTKYKLCVNCLRQGHPESECRMGPCRERGCTERHNILLHRPSSSSSHLALIDEQDENEIIVNYSNHNTNQVLLSTAIIEVSNPVDHQKVKVRALLDCGSQSSFISESLKTRLSLKSRHIDTLKVIGIGNTSSMNVIESCDI
ncbi:unnamed protein product [Pieris macdunnoughi]|uniref:Endonuclease/exonuclease/phosphatase domain-containing protein n=1 Tax=Pieris macdunnoughi TaxID=345717 RepID=A0A821XV22_9NEOP|nr:unnamed protein product [Pieris macdunnoughi]